MKKLWGIAFVLMATLCACRTPVFTVQTATDGKTPVTRQIQKAIDAASRKGGGIVTLPRGTYLTGSLILKSNVTLHLDRGATILGSTNFSDYASTPSKGRALIYAEDATNVAIEGEGVIDGRGYGFTQKDNAPRRPKNTLFFRCRNVRVEGVTMKNAGSWTCHFKECDGVLARGVTLNGHANFNNDGFDIECRDALITDCVIDNDDDAICFKSDNPDFIVENVTVKNCRASSNCNFIKFGTSCFGGYRNITVRDCELSKCSKSLFRNWEKAKLPGVTDPVTGLGGIALEVVDGGFMENVCVSNITMRDVQTPVVIRLARRHTSASSYLKNVLIQNVKGTSSSFIASSITGVPGLRVQGVTLRDIDLTLKAGGTAQDTFAKIPEMEKSYPENRMFGKRMLPAYGFYIRHADDILFENVRLRFAGGREERYAIFAEDASGIRLDRCSFQKPDGGLGTFRGVCGEVRELKNPGIWARAGKDSISLTPQDGGYRVAHTGKQDWALHGFGEIPVMPGDTFSLSAEIGPGEKSSGNPVTFSAILHPAEGPVSVWSFAQKSVPVPSSGTQRVETRFAVPFGTKSIEPRVIGDGPADVFLRNIRVERLAPVSCAPQNNFAITNNALIVEMNGKDGNLSMTDRRTGRCWKPQENNSGKFISGMVKTDSRIDIMFLNPETLKVNKTSVFFGKAPTEVHVEIQGEGEMTSFLNYPAAFETKKGDRLIVPMNEGMGFPVDEDHQGLYRMIAYGGHGICMSFFGVTEDATGAGWMCLLETSDDAAMNAYRPEGGNWTAGPSWNGQKERFGYTRKARYIFFDKGGYVAMAKRYRDYAKEIGKFVPFTEKVKKVPNIDKLIGAANIWNWDAKSKSGLVKEMQAAGIGRILWSAGGNAEDIKALTAIPNVLVGRYDIYQDIYYPEQMKKLGWKGKGGNADAYPQDINWAGPTSNEWRKAWGVKAPDGTWTYCAMMCDSKAVPYERKNVTEELKTKPYTARFIDTTVAAPWFECWNPAHPMTRSDSRFWKMELLRILGDEFHLVCGSETGHDASVPFCDYYEGMLSVGPYRVPDSGRNIQQIWTNVPPKTLKYQVGEKYRLPLWELVYHDCVCAHWYWGDYNNKLPDIWHKRDLFNALYGTAPMYIFTTANWKANKERFVESYKIAEPVARSTGYSEMLDHRILTPDRSVQQTVFANGVTVTVNFGDRPFTLPDGRVVAPSSRIVDGLMQKH